MKNGMLVALSLLAFSQLSVAQSLLAELTDADLADGERLFRIHCARCHGIDGEGGEGSNLGQPSLKYAFDDQAMIAVIDNGIPGTGMPAIWTLDDVQTARVAGYVMALSRMADEEMPGDPRKGQNIYRNTGGCPACHIIDGHGIGVGPELSDVGNRRGLDYLRSSLTDPASTQSQTSGYKDYLTVRLRTLNERVEGLRINEDAFSIQIRDVSGTVHSFRKDDLIEFEKIFAHSLMPEYGATLSGQDIDDVVSYLMSLRSE